MATSKNERVDLMAPTDLPDFEGLEVVEARAAVTNTGDGLSEAMHFAPFAIHQGQRGFLVLEFECVDVRHPYADKKKPEDGLARVHILRAETGLLLDDDVIAKAVEAQKEKIAKLRADEERRAKEERGEFSLPFADDDPADPAE